MVFIPHSIRNTLWSVLHLCSVKLHLNYILFVTLLQNFKRRGSSNLKINPSFAFLYKHMIQDSLEK